MAEREGFEPSVGLTLRRFSKPVPSATRPPLRIGKFQWFQLLIDEQDGYPQEQVAAGLRFETFEDHRGNAQSVDDRLQINVRKCPS